MLQVQNLTVKFLSDKDENEVVKDISFTLKKNKILGIVGESGSGKSVTSLAILGLLSKNAKIEGAIFFNDINLKSISEKEFQKIRGNQISMIFQEPMSSLNPSLTCGYQVLEILLQHKNISKSEAKNEVIELFNKVKLPRAETIFEQYPHQISGGQKQRVMIAMAIACKPQILIADEPTTALDVTIQAQILELIKKLQETRNVAVIFISHDLGVVAGIADKIIVMCEGTIRETGDTDAVFYHSSNDYTKKLLDAIPEGAKVLPNRVTSNEPLVEVSNLKTFFKNESGKNDDDRYIKAVNNVSLTIPRGEILGLVGESGSGKSTLGRSILQLAPTTQGSVKFEGKTLTGLSSSELFPWRRKMQMIFQDPYASLNPRMTVFETLSEPLLYHKLATKKTIASQIKQLMDDVGLSQGQLKKYPHEFSGGQRQRIAIGRAIATKPEFIIADEPVSALDVTIQAQILDLILDLVERHNLTMMFISHDLSVVRYICDRVVIMQHGVVVEEGDTEMLWANPQQLYTKDLLAAIPLADPISERSRIAEA